MLFIVEGKSAMSLAIEGLTVLGRDRFGAMPIRGKPVNAFGMQLADVMTKNPSVANVAKALGLRDGPFDASKLRYGKGLCIMTDQDDHGAHICGLLLTFVHEFWPEMLKEGRVHRFVTPLVKVFLNNGETLPFFDETVFEEWRAANAGRKYTTRYYKGLGGHSPEEVRSYFEDLSSHMKCVTYDEAGKEALNMAFDPKRALERRAWMADGTLDDAAMSYDSRKMSMEDIVNIDVRRFAVTASVSAIPAWMDGLKPVQRKAIFCANRMAKSQVMVPVLQGVMVVDAQYHYGQDSAQNAIINMAMSWPGSNNVALLQAYGAVGSRRGAESGCSKGKTTYAKGEDAASARYVGVSVAAITGYVLRHEDEPVVLADRVVVDGKAAEPKTYFPTIPLALVNGVKGIGMGHRVEIPNFDPAKLAKALLRRMTEAEVDWTTAIGLPHYDDFAGQFENAAGGGWVCRGVFEQDGDKITVREIPITACIMGYGVFLQSLAAADKITNLVDLSHTNRPHFTFTLKDAELLKDDAHKALKLVDSVSLDFKLWDAAGKIRRFTMNEYMEEWFVAKYKSVSRRKKWWVAKFKAALEKQRIELLFLAKLRAGKIRPGMEQDVMIAATMEVGMDEDTARAALSKRSVLDCSALGLDKEIKSYENNIKALQTYEATTVAAIWSKELTEFLAAHKEERAKTHQRNFYTKTIKPTVKRRKV